MKYTIRHNVGQIVLDLDDVQFITGQDCHQKKNSNCVYCTVDFKEGNKHVSFTMVNDDYIKLLSAYMSEEEAQVKAGMKEMYLVLQSYVKGADEFNDYSAVGMVAFRNKVLELFEPYWKDKLKGFEYMLK